MLKRCPAEDESFENFAWCPCLEAAHGTNRLYTRSRGKSVVNMAQDKCLGSGTWDNSFENYDRDKSFEDGAQDKSFENIARDESLENSSQDKSS